MESLFSWSDLHLDPPSPLMGQTGVIKIVDLVLLPYISFIIAFTALEWITYMKSLYSQSGLPPTPLMGHWVILQS